MKVTLIEPNIISRTFNSTIAASLPLGIAYLSSYLLFRGIDVQVIDAIGEGINNFSFIKKNYLSWGLSNNSILQQIDKKTSIIGITINHSCQHNIVLNLVKSIKKLFVNIPIVIGGLHGSESYVDFLENGVDYVVLGEGEQTFYDLCYSLKNKLSLDDVKGIAYKKNNTIINTEKRPPIKDLNSLPFPARSLFPLNNYFNSKLMHSPVNHNNSPILSSRGCSHKCSFCSIPVYWKGVWRGRNPRNIVAEIESCKKMYDIKEFHFMDDDMLFHKKRIIDFCKLLCKRNLQISWSGSTGLRSENIDDEMLFWMKKSGCNLIALSPESGSQRILKNVYNKKIDLNHIRTIIKKSNDLGIISTAYFVIGSDTETENDRLLTKNYIKSLAKNGLDEAGIFVLMAHPNTPLSLNMYNNKKNVKEWEDLVQGTVPISHKKHSYLKKYKTKLYLHFYFTQLIYHPSKIFRIIKNFILRKQETKTDRVLLSYIKTFFKIHLYPNKIMNK